MKNFLPIFIVVAMVSVAFVYKTHAELSLNGVDAVSHLTDDDSMLKQINLNDTETVSQNDYVPPSETPVVTREAIIANLNDTLVQIERSTSSMSSLGSLKAEDREAFIKHVSPLLSPDDMQWNFAKVMEKLNALSRQCGN